MADLADLLVKAVAWTRGVVKDGGRTQEANRSTGSSATDLPISYQEPFRRGSPTESHMPEDTKRERSGQGGLCDPAGAAASVPRKPPGDP